MTPQSEIAKPSNLLPPSPALVVRYLFLPRLKPCRRTSMHPNAEGMFTLKWHEYDPIYTNGYHIAELGPAAVKKGMVADLGVEQETSVLHPRKICENVFF